MSVPRGLLEIFEVVSEQGNMRIFGVQLIKYNKKASDPFRRDYSGKSREMLGVTSFRPT